MKLTVQIKQGDPRTSDKNWMIMGGDNNNPTWGEYLEDVMPEYQQHFTLIREAIESSEWMRATGEQFCNEHYFEFSDGVTATFSWRAWGDLMQAIVGEREGYMTYYM